MPSRSSRIRPPAGRRPCAKCRAVSRRCPVKRAILRTCPRASRSSMSARAWSSASAATSGREVSPPSARSRLRAATFPSLSRRRRCASSRSSGRWIRPLPTAVTSRPSTGSTRIRSIWTLCARGTASIWDMSFWRIASGRWQCCKRSRTSTRSCSSSARTPSVQRTRSRSRSRA